VPLPAEESAASPESAGSTDPRRLLAVALEAARAATAVHRDHVGRVDVRDWSSKGAADFVTYVDREAEAAIVARVRAAWPDHQILAEEAAADPGASAPDGNAEWLWVIDPLDGTTNFLHGYPLYSASVAVVHRGELLAGAVISGASGEEWSALRGGGAFRDGERIHVSAVEKPDLALIGTGFPFRTLDLMPKYLKQFDRITRLTAGVRRGGSAALDLSHVASGFFDGFWELYLAPWDVAAGALIIREAGGVITRTDGSADVVGHGPIVAGNPYIYPVIRGIVDAD
jgi:myo-inositol-1(or 4)-monophosphatase